MELGQPVDGLGEQVGLLVLEAVVLRVLRGVTESVGSRQIDHATCLADELGRRRHARLVRKAEEHHVGLGGPDRVERSNTSSGYATDERRVQIAGAGARLRVAGRVDDVAVRDGAASSRSSSAPVYPDAPTMATESMA